MVTHSSVKNVRLGVFLLTPCCQHQVAKEDENGRFTQCKLNRNIVNNARKDFGIAKLEMTFSRLRYFEYEDGDFGTRLKGGLLRFLLRQFFVGDLID